MLILVTKPGCKNCPVARNYLKTEGIPFVELSLDTPEKIEAFTAQNPTIRSVPVVLYPDGVEYDGWR